MFTERKVKEDTNMARAHVQMPQIQVPFFSKALIGLKRGPETPMDVPQGLNDVRPARLEKGLVPGPCI